MLLRLASRTIVGHRVSLVRSFSLVVNHADFLNLVKNHGTGDILLEETGTQEIMVLKLANPSRKNAISGRMMFQLANIVDTIVAMDMPSSHKAGCVNRSGLIVTGEGSIFCAGADFGLAREVLVTPELGRSMSLFMTDALNALRASSLISVCLLNGPAVGGGAEISTCGDFRIMAHGSFVRFIHARMGVSPGWGGIARLFSAVGRTHTLRLLGTSEVLLPAEAVALGFADQALSAAGESCDNGDVKGGTLIDSAVAFLRPYTTDQPFPDAVRCIKRAVVAITKRHLAQSDLSVVPTAYLPIC